MILKIIIQYQNKFPRLKLCAGIICSDKNSGENGKKCVIIGIIPKKSRHSEQPGPHACCER